MMSYPELLGAKTESIRQLELLEIVWSDSARSSAAD